MKNKFAVSFLLGLLFINFDTKAAPNSTWKGPGSDLLTSSNWTNGIPNSNATFDSTATNYTPTLASGSFSVHQFIFPSGGTSKAYTFTLSDSSQLIFNGGANNDGVHNDGGLTQTFNLSNTAQITFEDRSSADDGNQPGHIIYNLNSSTSKLNFNQAHNLTFASTINGSGGITFGGSAIQTFTSSTNTYTGSTTLTSGTLALSGLGSIANSSSVNISSGATLDISNATNGSTINNLSGSGSVITAGKTLTVNENSDTTFSGNISGVGGNLTKTGASKLTLTGANNY
jgi:autotransporter-associated beta strand protein